MTRPWHLVDSVTTDEGRLELRQRGESDFLITIDGRVLMNAASNLSEIVLAQMACATQAKKKRPKVLIGGLGMGFTLKAALDALPADAAVVVAELNPTVVTWCRGPIAHLTGRAVDDPRVKVVIGDVSACIHRAALAGRKERFDAIILDLYEGPCQGDPGRGEPLYGKAALALSHTALTTDGVLAVWSEDPDRTFETRLEGAGFIVRTQRPGRGNRHVVYIARKASGTSEGSPRPGRRAGASQKKRRHFPS